MPQAEAYASAFSFFCWLILCPGLMLQTKMNTQALC